MEKEKYCSECGDVIGQNECFCSNCGAEIPQDSKRTDEPVIGAGARANIMGGINKTITNHQQVNKSHVDNSSTINHNTTYVMNEKKEYCEVCGNSLEEKHARCPKCGREICLECKVSGKNRCFACEKKAVNDYRVAFQQFMLATNGNLGVSGRQMMRQKARDLDVEDVKDDIEKELLDLYQSSQKAVQPEVIPMTTAATTVCETRVGSKGGSVSNGRKVVHSQKGNNTVWMLIVGILVLIIVVFVLLNGEKKGLDAPVVTTEQVQEKQEKRVKQSDAAASTETIVTQKVALSEKSVVVEESVSKPVAVTETDANYDAGMKAYEAGNGLDAISAFKKSGSAKSYYMLGLIYENGCGNVGKNAMMARKNFKTAAQMGSEEAKAKL